MALLASLVLMLVGLAPTAARVEAAIRLRLGGVVSRSARGRALAMSGARAAYNGRPAAPRMPAPLSAAGSATAAPDNTAPPFSGFAFGVSAASAAPAGGASGGVGGVSELFLLNSLTKSKEPFVPLSGGRTVSWYICGPTVYDSAHLGHLRNYVGFDIVRRVLSDYFNYEICYVMNITDIDDKLIMRAHRRRLQAALDALEAAGIAAAPPLAAALADAQAALGGAEKSIAQVMAAAAALREAAAAAGGGAGALAASGALRDCEPKTELLALAREYETEFFADMRKVNVLPPTAVTRVTEYVPEVIAYIQTIERNGYCYATADGSVYFDTQAFASSHEYGKLVDRSLDLADLLADGEGALAAGAGGAAAAAAGGADAADGDEGGTVALGGKRRAQDFALWKASKAGEPAWESPWGAGRPGWHIECSAMASDLLGARVDINAGGVDLQFPHHENQMAQCEAFFDCGRWVNTFLHSGHLSIDGRKMSKSLKNFITVSEALERYSPSQLRFLFLMRRFSDPMEFAPNAMEAACATHERFAEFMRSLDIRIRETAPEPQPSAAAARAARAAETATALPSASAEKWLDAERALAADFYSKRLDVHAALCDSVDTAGALRALEQLLRATNRYLTETPPGRTSRPLVLEIGRYYAKLLRSFGVSDLPEPERYSPFGDSAALGGGLTAAEPFVKCLASFRDEVRALAAAGGSAAELLALCDRVRDRELRGLGVRLEDRTGEAARWALASPAELKAEAEAARVAAEKRSAARAAAQAKEAAVAAMRAVPAARMFAPEMDSLFGRTEPFSAWDAEGLPTHGADGEPLSKSARKKAEKAHAKQKENQAGR